MHWHKIENINQLNEIAEQSTNRLAVLIFKHSTRCSISSMALSRLEAKWINNDNVPTYYLDLLNYRDISNELSERYEIKHESPQVLIISHNKCVYHASHSQINAADIVNAIALIKH